MIQIRMRIHWDWRARLLTAGVLLAALLLLNPHFASQPAQTAEAIGASAFVPSGDGRHFYLTATNYHTNQPLTACAAGYHMASLWEILDVSDLTYDYQHPAAYGRADSGFGPPSNWYGWIRTGYDSSASIATGMGNCKNWTSTLATDYGVGVKLSAAWTTAPGSISSWIGTSFTCDFTAPVWCVGDIHTIFLPVVSRGL
jgi:hypothetical protein